MNRLKTAACLFILSSAFLICPAALSAMQPGALHAGDASACDGIVDPGDLAQLKFVLIGQAGDYSGCPCQCSDLQELSGDGIMDPTDQFMLKQWLLGDYTSEVGLPTRVEVLDSDTAQVVLAGDSVLIQARLFDGVTLGNGETDLRSGWGVVFAIDRSATTCAGAYLSGLDIADDTQPAQGDTVKGYTGCFADAGWAGLKLFATGCSSGDRIEVETWVPGSDARFPGSLDGPLFKALVSVPGPVCGDSLCEPPEDQNNCPEDCDWCGNGYCGPYEDEYTCPGDCCPCGDGICEFWAPCYESNMSCTFDCYCGDGYCSPDEYHCCADCIEYCSDNAEFYGASLYFDQTLSLNGHTVSIRAGDTACTADASGTKCWVRIINRDPDYYMANAFLTATTVIYAGDPYFENADLSHGVTVHPTNDGYSYYGGNLGDRAPIQGAGFTYVEDGDYSSSLLNPYNVLGAGIHRLSPLPDPGLNKPFQVIYPDCGSKSYIWQFSPGLSSANFWIELTADFLPWVPTGQDRARGGGDDDPRYDWQDRTTFYVTVTDLADNHFATNYLWYRIGSYKRSNVLAGYGAVGSGKAVLSPGQYFAVNVAVEYPDRIEQRTVGNPYQFTNYEYFRQFGYLLKFDPSTVGLVGTANKLMASGTRLFGLSNDQNLVCWTWSSNVGCDLGGNKSTYTGDMAQYIFYGNDSQGWIGAAPAWQNSSSFKFFTATGVWQTTNGGTLVCNACFTSLILVPKRAGHTGIAHLDGQFGAITALMTSGAWMIQEGADPDPDMPLRMHYFYVRPGTSGRGSEFWIDTASAYTNFRLAWTNGTFPGGVAAGTDDWLNYCWPMDPAFMDNTNQGCGADNINRVISSGQERSNYAITHSGEAVPGYNDGSVFHRGAYQQWPAHICVQ